VFFISGIINPITFFFIADVFSLQFESAVPETSLSSVRAGIQSILRLLNCHDSKHIYVSLVQNSVNT